MAAGRKSMPTSYALGGKFNRFVARLLKSGRYNSKSEVIREGLRLLEEREATRAMQIEELRKAFREGIASGRGIPAEKVFAELKGKYSKMAEDRGM
jgi:putative addiction module antidote protein, CC2985 family